ncbi:MAG: hypothetical protein U1F27_11070 [Turneriella sp.]
MNSVGFIKVKEYAFLAVAALSLLTASCKINKDANCDNPKAACFKKDTEQPTVDTSTNPVSTAKRMPTADGAELFEPSVSDRHYVFRTDEKCE